MVCSPVTVRIAPPNSKLTRSPAPERLINSTLPSPSSSVPDPCAKETVLNALKERKKRIVEEEDQVFVDGQENKRRRHDSSGSGHSAFEPLVANGVPASFVPKPGSLKRGLTSQSSDDHLNKRSRTSSVSSLTSTCTGGILSSSRNAITSSYSSTRGISQLWKRSGPPASPFSSPASSRSQTPERPAKKTREGSQQALFLSLVADTTSRNQPNSWASPSTPGSSGQRKRKIPLLPSRRGDQLTLPPPPQLGYSVTAEDLDLEKKASLQWFNKVLEDKTDVSPNSVSENPPATQPSFTFTLPAVGTPSAAASPQATGTNPLLESLKKMQSPPDPSLPESAEVATTTGPSPLKTPSLLTSLGSPPPGPLPGTSSDSKSTATFLGLVPASSTAPVVDTKSPPALQTDTSAKAPGPPTPSPTSKQSGLFGMSSTTPAALATSSASPMFKPIFMTPPKSESEGPSVTSVTAAAVSSSTQPMTTSTATPTFKPIFGDLGPPASVPLPAPFSFKPTTAAAAPAAPLFAGLATATSAMAPTTTASTSTDSASKPAFCFGVSSVASAGGSTTGSVTPASHPFPFGAPPASAASFTPAVGSVFQFGKSTATPTSTAATTFGQSLPGAVEVATTSSSSNSNSTAGFSGFGSSLATSACTTSSQPTLTFSNTTTPAFSIPFGSSAKPSLPAYPVATPQPTFGAADGQQQGSSKPALAPSFGSSFTFGNSAAPAPSAAPATAQPAFGSSTQSAFGLKTTASAFGAPASTQPAFGGTTPVFSFGAATTSGFGATTQTTPSGTSGSVFGSSTPSPFTFGGSAAPAASGGFGLSVAAPGPSSTSGAFSFGAGQSGTTGTATPFGGGLSQNALGAPSQSTPFAFNVAGTPESKPVFGGTSTPTFGQSTPTAGVGTVGSSLSFGASSTPTQGFVGVGPFGSAAPSFSIGAGSKTPGARQRLQARRQHNRKK
uniref:Nuclear envelope pore membrane protein POM 121C n=1 Tax=Marmota marmota marmota TaxID=9994 RepID=A0A8C5ZAL1_MARMA